MAVYPAFFAYAINVYQDRGGSLSSCSPLLSHHHNTEPLRRTHNSASGSESKGSRGSRIEKEGGPPRQHGMMIRLRLVRWWSHVQEWVPRDRSHKFCQDAKHAHAWLAQWRASWVRFAAVATKLALRTAAVVLNRKQAPTWGSVYRHGRVIQQLSRAPPASKRQALICGSGVSAGQCCDEKPNRWQCPSE